MKKKQKKLLSLLTALTLAASSFAGLAISARAEVIAFEDFDDYEDEEIISTTWYNNDADPVPSPEPRQIGDIIYSAGVRKGGNTTNTASFKDKKLYVKADRFSNSERGIKAVFSPASGTVPTLSEISDGEIIELSFDITATGSFSTTGTDASAGVGEIKNTDLNGGTHVRIVSDKTAQKKYMIANDESGNVTAGRVRDVVSEDTAITGLSFCVGAGEFTVDNLKLETKNADTGILNIKVVCGSEAVAGADIVIDNAKFTTDADGSATIGLPVKTEEYAITVSGFGYEATAGQKDAAIKSVTMMPGTNELVVELLEITEAKTPSTVTIDGGQVFIAAPLEEDTSVTEAYTVEVLDQFDKPMSADEYEIEWNVYPAGTENEDANVTINSEGVVFVSKDFKAANGSVTDYDVVASVTSNNVTTTNKKALSVGNDNVMHFEHGNWKWVYDPSWDVNRYRFEKFDVSQELPYISTVSVKMKFSTLGSETASQRTWALMTNGADSTGTPLVGLQYTKENTIVAWTDWTGSRMNNNPLTQSSDIGAFDNSFELISDYIAGDEIDVEFEINTITKKITVSCDGRSEELPYAVNAVTLDGMVSGLYRTANTGNLDASDFMIKGVEDDYFVVYGDDELAKVSGAVVTRENICIAGGMTPDETLTWSISGDNLGENETITETRKGAKLKLYEVPENDMTATVVKAMYNGGALQNVKMSSVNIAAGSTEVEITEEAAGVTIMLWDSTTGMKPLAAKKLSGEYTVIVGEEEAGISIDSETGVLSVKDTAKPGVITITCESSKGRKSEFVTQIYGFQVISPDKITIDGLTEYFLPDKISGPAYTITSAIDPLKDDVADVLPAPVWSSSDDEVVSITPEGVATAKKEGSATLMATITNGTAISTATIDVTVAIAAD